MVRNTSSFTMVNSRYAELRSRLNRLNNIGAGCLTGLTLASIWGRWGIMGTVVATQIPVIGFNIWVNLDYLGRRGRQADLARTLINCAAIALTAHVSGWTIPNWIWLPFVALAYDHLDTYAARLFLVLTCAVVDTTALYRRCTLGLSIYLHDSGCFLL